ncbi:MAG: cytochrome c oxidase subunit II [Prochlorotrichaceae cyanobacterium]|jgi:cytochrome c oxidase subunit 2
MQQVPISLFTLIAGVLVTIISIWVGQHPEWLLPEQVSQQAPLVDNFFAVMLMIGTALFLVVQGALFLFAILFRRRPGDDSDGSPIEGNVPLEIVWTAIPAIIVICVGVYSVEVYAEMGGFDPAGQELMMAGHSGHHQHLMDSAIAGSMDDMEAMQDMAEADQDEPQMAYVYGIAEPAGQNTAADLVVSVTGMQYAWIFEYPDGIIDGELHIPIGQSVQLDINAVDVIHSFWLPQFRLKQDALPGQSSQLRFVAIKTGTYPIVCAELCGAYHGSMRTQVIVHEPEEYEAWHDSMIVAQRESSSPVQVAVNTAAMSDREYLEPYGIDSTVLNQLRN